MRKLYIILTSIILIAFSGCENAFRDELHEIHNEIDELRVMIDKANSNIEALQTIVYALQEKDYVTGVTPIIENGVEVGYTIAFSKSGIATIYHGKDGYTPQIGVRKDTDSLYYWTLDGQWLLDEDGKKIRAVGVDGEDGIDGVDGRTPVIGVRQHEGVYYWTLDGEWLTDSEGNKIPTTGKDGGIYITDRKKINLLYLKNHEIDLLHKIYSNPNVPIKNLLSAEEMKLLEDIIKFYKSPENIKDIK